MSEKKIERALSRYLREHVETILGCTFPERTWLRYAKRLKTLNAFNLATVNAILKQSAPGTTFLEAINRWHKSGGQPLATDVKAFDANHIGLIKARFRAQGIPPSTYSAWFLKAGVAKHQTHVTDRQRKLLDGFHKLYNPKPKTVDIHTAITIKPIKPV